MLSYCRGTDNILSHYIKPFSYTNYNWIASFEISINFRVFVILAILHVKYNSELSDKFSKSPFVLDVYFSGDDQEMKIYLNMISI